MAALPNARRALVADLALGGTFYAGLTAKDTTKAPGGLTPEPSYSTPVPTMAPTPSSSPEGVCGIHAPLVVYVPSPAPAESQIPGSASITITTAATQAARSVLQDLGPELILSAFALLVSCLELFLPTHVNDILKRIRATK